MSQLVASTRDYTDNVIGPMDNTRRRTTKILNTFQLSL